MTAVVIPEWTLADRLRKAREYAGLDQQEMADRIGISRRSVVNYEGGKHAPGRPVLLSMALATGVPLAWLMDGSTTGPIDGGATSDLGVSPSAWNGYRSQVIALGDAA